MSLMGGIGSITPICLTFLNTWIRSILEMSRHCNPVEDSLESIAASLAQLVVIEQKRLLIAMLDATKLGKLFDLLTQLLAALPGDAAKIADLQGQIATLTANDAALDALSPQLDPLIASVTAAQPPVVPPAPAPAG
jgi:hypothetical protein